MKKFNFIFILLYFFSIFLFAEIYPEKELNKFEAKLIDLRSKSKTLEEFAPSKFPGFSELGKTNQLIEQIDFFKRKFKLLLSEYNTVTDEVFPFIKKSGLTGGNKKKLKNYLKNKFSGKGEFNLLDIQKQLNFVLLRISRFENELDMVRMNSRQKEITEEKAKKSSGTDTSLPVNLRIRFYEEEKKSIEKEIGTAGLKLSELKKAESSKSAKIEEKNSEIKEMKKKRYGKNRIEEIINSILSNSIGLRVNGLEIPLLNTVKTRIYLEKTKISALKEKSGFLTNEIILLKKERVKKIKSGIIKGVVVLLLAFVFVFSIIRLSTYLSKKALKRIEKSKRIDAHKKQRYETLSSVILSFVKIVLWTSSAIWVMGILNIDYGPFLMAAGGISLAIGFGAQSLVKDLVTGFFLLMEEQFALGDVVEINGKTGTIEKISLRTVKFRSLDGTLHTIPNGNISSVSNSTYQWSRAVANIGVSYNDDHEKVISVLGKICDKMYKDEAWREKFIEKPIPQGILSFGDSAVNYRIIAKTVTGQQWGISRELNIRIKREFDKQGIEIPYNYINVVEVKS